MESLFADPDVQSLNLTKKIHSKNYDQDLEYVRHPISLSGTEHKFSEFTEPPSLGQHTNEVLESLGYSQDKISQLKMKDVI